MATINQIANNIITTLGQPYSIPLRDRIKFIIRYHAPLYIRRDSQRNLISDTYLNTYETDLIKVDRLDNCDFDLGCDILRTENKIPTPTRFKGRLPFTYVGTLGGIKSFIYTKFYELDFTRFNEVTSNSIRYDYVNNYIYVFNNLKIKKIQLISAFTNLEDYINTCNKSCDQDNQDYPVPLDIIKLITSDILNGEIRLDSSTSKDVNIVDNDKN